jgi:Tol biopolymer transport system component
LIEIDVKTRAEREISDRRFFNIGHLRWLPDKSGLLFSAFERFYRPYKIYQVLNETGEVQTLTDDSNDYRQISFDNAFRKMIATRTVPDYRLWVGATDALNSATPICSSQLGIAFTTSGKIIYTSISDGIHNIWTINADGTNQRQLTSNQEANRFPRVSADERFIYFASNRTGSNQVWRMQMDGSNQIQISTGEGGIPIYVSADGHTVYYETAINNNLGKITVNSDGNKVSTIVSNERIRLAEINFAEDTAAYFSRTTNQDFEIALMSLADGKILKTFQLPEENSYPLKIVWANDGKSLFYLVRNDARKTIWELSLETGKSVKFTEFSGDEEVEDFAFSADLKTFAYIRGKWEHDAFLITGLK